MTDERRPSEIVMDTITGIRGRNTVLVSEMIDALLDILNAVTATERAAKEAVKMWSAATALNDRYKDRYGLLPPEQSEDRSPVAETQLEAT